jgi:hypothetical protein
MTIKEAQREKGVARRDNPKHRSNCLKSLRCHFYRYRKVLSMKKTINLEIAHECGCDRAWSLAPMLRMHRSLCTSGSERTV